MRDTETTKPQSPFLTHRDKILGKYGAATFLRSVVMAMWNGGGYPTGLSSIRNLDRQHFEAFLQMVNAYHRDGESDAHFMALANEIRSLHPKE